MRRGQILLVDDLPDQRATFAGLLADEGWKIHTAASQEEALALLGANEFDVAVLDMRLDETNEENREGLHLMRIIKQRAPRTAVIILTGYADVEAVQEVLSPGADGIAPAFGFLRKDQSHLLPERVAAAYDHMQRNQENHIHRLIAGGENERTEFKASLRWDYQERMANNKLREPVAKAIAGMLNAQGGQLLIGVDDDGAILGIEQDLRTLPGNATDRFVRLLTDLVRDHLGLQIVPLIHPTFHAVQEKRICVVSVDKSDRPVYFQPGGKFLLRTGNSTRELDTQSAVAYIGTCF